MAEILGDDAPNDIDGTDGDDSIAALGGNDTVYAGAGADTVDLGSGNDLAYGGTGEDRLVGGDGHDSLIAANPTGPDGRIGDVERDTLEGGSGNDWLQGGFSDVVDGGRGDDRLILSGLDLDTALDLDLRGQTGGTYVFGSTGGSATEVESMSLTLSSGDDRIRLGSSPDMRLLVQGAGGDDTLLGGDTGDEMNGGLGNDRIGGGGGNDYIVADEGGGPRGRDVVTGDAGDDTMFGGTADTLSGGDGTDVLTLSLSNHRTGVDLRQDADGTLQARSGNVVTLADGFESVTAYLTRGNDIVRLAGGMVVFAGAGDDTMIGGAQDDVFRDEAGSDVFIGRGGADLVSMTSSFGPALHVDLAIRTAQPSGATETVTVRGIEHLVGRQYEANTLFGTAAGNALAGGREGDTLVGRSGDDTLTGSLIGGVPVGSDHDTLRGGAGDDVLDGGMGADLLDGGGGADTYLYTWRTGLDTVDPDRISRLEAIDVIDLSAVDAVPNTLKHDAFMLVDGPSDATGALWWSYDAAADLSVLQSANAWPRLTAAGDVRDFDNFIF